MIAEKTLDTSSKAPRKYSTSMEVDFDRSITNTRSDVTVKFISPMIVFDEAILTLPQSVSLDGECSFSSTNIYANEFTCEKIDSTNIKIIMSFDKSYMMGE